MTGKRDIQDGTWIRSNVPVTDGGDYNERTAAAGAVGRVELSGGTGDGASYSVVFWPSFVSNFWDRSEIDEDATVLPEGHPDIPTKEEFDFASAVADIVADGDVDPDERTVTAPESVVDRIVAGAGAGRYGANPEVARMVRELCGEGGCEVTFSFEEFDALAELAGVGDRLNLDDPFPKP